MPKNILIILLLFFFTFTSCTDDLKENLEQEIESIENDQEMNDEESDNDENESGDNDDESDNDDDVEQEVGSETADYIFIKGYYEDYGTVAFGYDGNLIQLTLFTEGLDYELNATNSLQLVSTTPMGSGTYSVINIYSPQSGQLPVGEYRFDTEKEIWTFQDGFLCTDCTTFNDSGITSTLEGGLITITEIETEIESNYIINLLFELENGETISGHYTGSLINAETLYED